MAFQLRPVTGFTSGLLPELRVERQEINADALSVSYYALPTERL